MKLAIVDDLESDRTALIERLRQYETENKLHFSIAQFESGEAFLQSFSPGAFALVFLDVFMSGKTGMEVAKELYGQDTHCKLIFLTTSREYSLLSYSVHAVYYLVKPIAEHEFRQAMEFCGFYPSFATPTLSVVCDRVPLEIATEEILYIDFSERQTRLHLTNLVLSVSGSFTDVTKPLNADERFLVCYKGIMVNLSHIRQQSDKGFVLNNGEQLPIRQRERQKLRKLYLNYLSAHLRDSL